MDWTEDRIEPLSTAEVRQLRANAGALGKQDVVALCDGVLRHRPKGGGERHGGHTPVRDGRHLVSRSKAFEMRGVLLQDPTSSRGGVRRSDGTVVMTIWADDIRTADGTCSYLLWAPNVNGSRPWSDKPGGKERLEHCRRAVAHGAAEGLLVYGERLEGELPEDKASTVHGTDPNTVLRVLVTQRGEEFWATWGKKVSSVPR